MAHQLGRLTGAAGLVQAAYTAMGTEAYVLARGLERGWTAPDRVLLFTAARIEYHSLEHVEYDELRRAVAAVASP